MSGPAARSAADEAALAADIRATLMPGFAGLEAPAWILDAFGDGLLAACVYGENIRDAAQLHALGARLRAAAPSALLAIDEEGGEVTRLHYRTGSPYPGAAVLGRLDDLAGTEEAGARVGADVLAAGFDLVLGPVADVNSNPANPVIGTRSFGADPALVARHAAAWVRGVQASGALACPKHFPGHGDTDQDSHLALPVVDVPRAVLEARDLPPFRAAIAAGAGAVMTSHILLPRIDPTGPATFSRPILQGILREELGFTGLIVSDALDMHGASGATGIPEAAVRALAAGCDLLCLGTDRDTGAGTGGALLREIEDAVRRAVHEGRLERGRLREAADRVRAATRRERRPREEGTAAVSSETVGLGRIASAFEGAATARAWLRAHPRAAVLRIESEANMAVGAAPWGPFAAQHHPLPGTEHLAAAFAARPVRTVAPAPDVPWLDGEDAPDGVLVIGRDLRRPQTAVALAALREAGVPVLAVEMGWPGRVPGDADLACYGSSRLVGAALLELIEGEGSRAEGASAGDGLAEGERR